MKKTDIQIVNDLLLEKIKAFIQSVYTGKEEPEDDYPRLAAKQYCQSAPAPEEKGEKRKVKSTGFKDKIIKVFNMAPDESVDDTKTDVFDDDDDIIYDELSLTEGFSNEELEDLLKKQEVTFSEALLSLIDEKGLTDPEVYKKANIDRKHFQKMKKPAYRPGKAAAISLGLALELDFDALQTFIGRADHQLSRAFKTDIVIEYCVNHDIFDVFQVNDILYEMNLPVLSNY